MTSVYIGIHLQLFVMTTYVYRCIYKQIGCWIASRFPDMLRSIEGHEWKILSAALHILVGGIKRRSGYLTV